MWHLPGPGIELVSPALRGGFLTTGPPGKPSTEYLKLSAVDILAQISLCQVAGSCLDVGCLAASLASTGEMLVAPSPSGKTECLIS